MTITGIIPARYASTRLPGKPLSDINGQSMIMRVYNQALKANLSEVVVATDDERILNHVLENKGKAVLTRSDHVSGTDRCLEAALQCETEPHAVINIQGDEPFISPEKINLLVKKISEKESSIATLIKPTPFTKDLNDANKVKVVIDNSGKALFFSRSLIPANRTVHEHIYFQHIGVYAYTLNALKEITALRPSDLEQKESLEQLRWLENGYTIKTAQVTGQIIGVDTPSDLQAAIAYAKRLEG